MARMRTIKPEFWTSEQVASVSRDARLIFIGIWNFCDDAGRHPASAKRLKMEVLPGDAVSTDEVTRWVRELIDVELIEEYEFEGDCFWQVTGWHHQKIDQPYIKHPDANGKLEKPSRRLGGKQRQLLYKKLVERDGEKCVICGSLKNLAIDHKIPRSKGGTNDIENLQLLCKPCNNEKFTSDTNGTRQVRDSDAPPEGKGKEGKGIPPSIHPSSARAREEKPKTEKPKPGPSVETVDLFRTMPPEIWTEENELSVLRKFTQWWNKKKPAERNNLDMLAAVIAARHGEPKADPAWYAAKCLDGGVRPNWITHAQALIKKSERTVHR